MSNQITITNSPNMLALPAVEEIAKRYGLDAAAFAYTFRSVAMPQPHTEPEFVSCILVAREHGLNPLTKELYFMKTKGGAIQPIVSVDGWTRKCNEHPQFDGMEFSDAHNDDGKIVSTTCIIYRKDRSHPIRVTEYLDECMTGAGPVWKSHPRRMLRHRALTQAARYAFGFAGIMDRDEFDQWQAMKDVTPTASIAKPASGVPEIPDIPDVAPIAEDPARDDDSISEGQQAELVEKIREDLSLCKTPAERAEVAENYDDVLDRVSDKTRRTIERLFEGR